MLNGGTTLRWLPIFGPRTPMSNPTSSLPSDKPAAPSNKRRVLQGSASNVVRLVLSMLVSLVLPPFLVHHMPPAEYSAWVLILQLSTYVGLLDLGMQTAIGKFVAEYDAAQDHE